MQKLTDVTPNGFYSHNTGGEHCARVMGDEHHINNLRVLNGLTPIEELDIMNYALHNDGYVMLHRLLDDGLGAEPELSGYVLATKGNEGSGYTFVIDDILVNEPLRRQSLGSFLIGKLATKGFFPKASSVLYPEGINVPTEKVSNETVEWFLSRGFKQTDESLALRLPGNIIYSVKQDDLRSLIQRMPNGWNGAIEEIPADGESSTIHVYRDATHVGNVQQIPDEDQMLFRVSHDGESSFEGSYTWEFFAIVSLLNGVV